MNDDNPTTTSKVYKALSVPVRRQILEHISREGPVDLKTLIDVTGMKEPTVRHHLLVLERAGLISMSEEHQGSRGRPRMLFTMTHDHWSIGFPQRQYQMLAEHLLQHIIEREGAKGAVKALRKIGQDVAQSLLDEVTTAKGSDEVEIEDVVKHILPALDQLGSIVEAIDTEDCDLQIQMRNCIFFELAQAYHGIICQGHAAIFETIAKALGKDYESVAASCLASGDDRCITCIKRRK